MDEVLKYNDAKCDVENACVIEGADSTMYGYDTYKKALVNLKREDYHLVGGAGHWVHAEKPIDVVNIIDSFLNRI